MLLLKFSAVNSIDFYFQHFILPHQNILHKFRADISRSDAH